MKERTLLTLIFQDVPFKDFVALEFKLPDFWIGVFWKTCEEVSPMFTARRIDIWACLLPCLPVHVGWHWGIKSLFEDGYYQICDKCGRKTSAHQFWKRKKWLATRDRKARISRNGRRTVRRGRSTNLPQSRAASRFDGMARRTATTRRVSVSPRRYN